MLVSYRWLQTYFKEELPAPQALADTLTMRAFEVESIEEVGDDFILDIDILPNRAHDCLSHRGIAAEAAVLLDMEMVVPEVHTPKTSSEVRVSIENQSPEVCRRYMGRLVRGVRVGPSPKWLQERLEAIGQKSINNIVDATNYAMFDVGQPLHAFDADKVEGGIVIRKARKGERMVTLDGKEVELDEHILVIADKKEPLAIAGVKGGKKAEVDEHTENIILEAANFDPVTVRKTSRALNIPTDSSKRFENEITPELATHGMEAVTALIASHAAGEEVVFGDVVDIYPRRAHPYKVGVSLNDTNELLGTSLDAASFEQLLNRLQYEYEKVIPREKIKTIISSGELLGKPYKSGASVTYDAPEYFDCSSLAAWLYKEAGLSIPRISVDQFVFSDRISDEHLQPGDLIFANTGLVIKTGIYKETVEFLPGTPVPEGVDHVGVYAGDGRVLHTSSKTGAVALEPIEGNEMFCNIVGYGNVAGIDEERYVITVPELRLDVRIKEDVIEEIGRVLGYDTIEPVEITKEDTVPVSKKFYYLNKIRNILVQLGFSEVYISVFARNGTVAVENPIASDKKFLRDNLKEKVLNALEENTRYADLLEVEVVKMFELGKVFDGNGEQTHLCMAVYHPRRKKQTQAAEDLKQAVEHLMKSLGATECVEVKEYWIEINIDKLIASLPDPKSYDSDVFHVYNPDAQYKRISPYPFVVRDIALWVPEGVEEDEIKEVIKKHTGPLLVAGPRLFDRFEKKNEETGEIDRISYAFRMVFQSHERTLTDDEVNDIMRKITDALNSKEGWEVR